VRPADSIFSRTPPSAPPVNQPFMTRPGSNEATDVFSRPPAAMRRQWSQLRAGRVSLRYFFSRGQVNAAMAAPQSTGEPAMPAADIRPASLRRSRLHFNSLHHRPLLRPQR